MKKIKLFFIFALLIGTYLIKAADVTGTPTAIAFQSNNKYLVAGVDSTGKTIQVTRYNLDKTIDTNYGTNGTVKLTEFIATTSAYVYDMIIDRSGKAVLAVNIDGAGYTIRFTTNGVLDVTFVPGAAIPGIADSITGGPCTSIGQLADSSGSQIYAVAGYDTTDPNKIVTAIISSSDGQIDYNRDLDGSTPNINALVVSAASDNEYTIAGTASFKIGDYSWDGAFITLDKSYEGPTGSDISGIVRNPNNNNFCVVGLSPTPGFIRISCYTHKANGDIIPNPNFGGGQGYIDFDPGVTGGSNPKIAVLPNGTLGVTVMNSMFNITIINPNGTTTQTTVGPDGTSTNIAAGPNDQFYVVGYSNGNSLIVTYSAGAGPSAIAQAINNLYNNCPLNP